ncbi:MAG: hypothetical protein AB4080_13950 [Trichodesmium sp.]
MTENIREIIVRRFFYPWSASNPDFLVVLARIVALFLDEKRL